MNRRQLIKHLGTAIPAIWTANKFRGANFQQSFAGNEPIADGPFKPNWNSLQQYAVPDWFRDAKFGIWAHWGPQCQPEYGDWYARSMYIEGSSVYKYHLDKYGHPSKFGFKDVINEWKAEAWNPEQLLQLYKRAGAQYFVALANHHDNFDNYNSKYQDWNAVSYGPQKDIIGGWEAAARKNGLRFGVSVHAAHAWSWYEQAQKADRNGPLAGVPYDGKLTKESGKNTWWSKLDPQDLYAQQHPLSEGSENESNIHRQWNWGNGVTPPSKTYCDKFLNRTIDLINQYNPDLVYFDDTALPLWPVNDAGLKIAAHFYNSNIKKHGRLEAVLNGKILDEQQRQCMVWDIERGQSNIIETRPWQTDTCIGNWHYDRPLYERHGYKSAATVIHTLIDVVSKNGNLLLSIPVRGNGTIDSDEQAVLENIAAWMEINRESIFGSRPWTVLGEGPALDATAPLTAQGFNEGKGKPFTAADIRFTRKNNSVYCFLLGQPVQRDVIIHSLGENAIHMKGKKIEHISLLGNSTNLVWSQTEQGLIVEMPSQLPSDIAVVFKISGAL